MIKPAKAYRQWLHQLKERIRSAQIKAAVRVNTELLNLYWGLGKEILEKEKETDWGDMLIEKLSKDLLSEFPEMKGFSVTNLYYVKRWFLFYNQLQLTDQQLVVEILPQVVAELAPRQKLPVELGRIPWGHHREIITKCKDIEEALFYISQTIQYNWSRSVLVHQIESNLYKRKGKALTNFEYTLPKSQSELANELLKNPYHFEFLMLGPETSEKELEDALLTHLTKFLLELLCKPLHNNSYAHRFVM